MTFETLHEIIAQAQKRLEAGAWDYIAGGSESETTLQRNRFGLDALAFRPRVLRDVSGVDPSVERFGRRLRLPILLAPIGGLEVFDPGAGATVVRAAHEFGVGHMVSSVSLPGLEGVAQAAPDALRIFQLYVRGDDRYVEDHVERAISSGYTAFCITVDTAVLSRRERDITKRYKPTHRRRRESGLEFQAMLSWRTVDLIKKKFAIPLVLKGISTPEDAKLALDHGVDWIYVSNHGGRQLDHTLGSIEVLPEIVDAVRGRARVIVDGSFNRGTDIVKAVALGADLVGLGRMQCYALGAAGQAGVVRMLEILEDEVRRCLALLGVNAVGELDATYLRPAQPMVVPGAFSAFPLLRLPEQTY